MGKGNKYILSITITISFFVFTYNIYLKISKDYYKEKFGLKLNEARKRYCIPIIEESWDLIEYNKKSIIWGYFGFPAIKKPFHYRKESILSEGKVIIEKDTYQYNFSDSVEYRLIIWSDFIYKSVLRSELLTYYLFKVNIGDNEFDGTDVISDSLNLMGMKKILNDWEIPYSGPHYSKPKTCD